MNRIEFTDEDNCVECDEAIEGLEKIDDETDALDITMVKVNDARYAKKYGVNKMPALVYFRRKFPSIYRDNLFDEDTILEWLTSNRFTNCITLQDFWSCYYMYIYGVNLEFAENSVESHKLVSGISSWSSEFLCTR